jgi:hypothetical protein
MQDLDDPEFIPIGCCYQDIYYNVESGGDFPRRRSSPNARSVRIDVSLVISMEEELLQIMERSYSM